MEKLFVEFKNGCPWSDPMADEHPWSDHNYCKVTEDICSSSNCAPYKLARLQQKRVDDATMRLHNTEVALLALWSLIRGSIAIHAAESVDEMMEEYFYHQERLGAFSNEQFFRSDDPIDDVSYTLYSDEEDFDKLNYKLTNLSIVEAHGLKGTLEKIHGFENIRIIASNE